LFFFLILHCLDLMSFDEELFLPGIKLAASNFFSYDIKRDILELALPSYLLQSSRRLIMYTISTCVEDILMDIIEAMRVN